MNSQKEYVSDCETDDDYYVDLLTSGKGSDKSESDVSDKSENYPGLKSKHTAKALRKTRHCDGDNREYRSKECDDLHSEEESEKSRSDALWADFLGDIDTKSVINQKQIIRRETQQVLPIPIRMRLVINMIKRYGNNKNCTAIRFQKNHAFSFHTRKN